MHTMTLKIKDEKNFIHFLNLLKHIDFIEIEDQSLERKYNETLLDEMAGLWKGRDISLNTIRKVAWENRGKI